MAIGLEPIAEVGGALPYNVIARPWRKPVGGCAGDDKHATDSEDTVEHRKAEQTGSLVCTSGGEAESAVRPGFVDAPLFDSAHLH